MFKYLFKCYRHIIIVTHTIFVLNIDLIKTSLLRDNMTGYGNSMQLCMKEGFYRVVLCKNM